MFYDRYDEWWDDEPTDDELQAIDEEPVSLEW